MAASAGRLQSPRIPALRDAALAKRLLYDFSVQCEVETVALGVLCHAQADNI